MPEQINELTDVEVETLGLVTRGANREEFFLLKAEDATPVTPEVEAAAQNIWQRLLATIKKALTEPTFADEPLSENAAKVLETPEVIKQEVIQVEPIITETVVVTPEPSVVPEPVAKQVSFPMENKQESAPVTNTQTEAPMAELESVAKADFDALAVRLEKAEVELAKAQGEKERAVWLQKAQTYSYMPVASTDLAEQLQYLAKAAPTRAEWWMDVLKACDNMVKDSGLFVEKGTTIEAESAVTQVLKSDNPREAALNMPRADAEAYLKDVRRRGQGGR